MQRRRERLAIHEDHVVALAVPVEVVQSGLAKVLDVQVAADVVPLAGGLEHQVVALAIEIGAAELELVVGHPLVGDPVGRVLTTPLRVEAPLPRVHLGDLVVDVVVEEHVLGALAGDLEARALVRHREPAVEGLPVLRAHLQRQRDEVARLRVAHAEEVPHRHLDAWLPLAVPPGAQHDLSQMVDLAAGDGQPDVADHPGLVEIGQDRPAAARDGDAIVVAAGAVVARGPRAARPGQAGEVGEGSGHACLLVGDQPLRPVSFTPSTSLFWRTKNRIKVGSAAQVDAAMIRL